MRETLFLFFGLFSIACAMGVVFARNPIYSAFSLILSFFGLSALYILWGAVFIGIIQILVYTGAIVVLFVFVVMLLNLGRLSSAVGPGRISVVTVAACVWILSLFLLRTLNRSVPFSAEGAQAANGMRVISKLLFTQYLWPFEILSLFLLALIVAIFSLSRPEEQDR